MTTKPTRFKERILTDTLDELECLKAELTTVKAEKVLVEQELKYAVTEAEAQLATVKAERDQLREMCMENETEARWATEALKKAEAELARLRGEHDNLMQIPFSGEQKGDA